MGLWRTLCEREVRLALGDFVVALLRHDEVLRRPPTACVRAGGRGRGERKGCLLVVLDGLVEAAKLRVRHPEPVVREPLRRDVLARLRRQQEPCRPDARA